MFVNLCLLSRRTIIGFVILFSVPLCAQAGIIFDSEGDQEPGYPSWMDIVEASAHYNAENTRLVFTVRVASPIPVEPDRKCSFMWLIDYDMQGGGLGNPINDIEFEIGPGIRDNPNQSSWGNYYGLWDFCNDPPACMDPNSMVYDFSPDRKTLTVEYSGLDADFMNDFYWVLWCDTIPGFWTAEWVDIAPNGGHGFCEEVVGVSNLWIKTFGVDGANFTECAQQTTDGGFILAGVTDAFGGGSLDVCLVRTDENGDPLWTRTFGGSSYEFSHSVCQTAGDGFILLGYTNSFGAGGYDILLIRTDENGDLLWARTFGGSSDDYCQCVRLTTDGGVVLGGVTTSFGVGACNAWLVRTDGNGDLLWTRTFGGDSTESFVSLDQTWDGGFVLGGWTNSFGAASGDVLLIRTDENGDPLWTRTYGDGMGGSPDVCYSVHQTSDGGFVLAGFTDSFGAGGNDAWLVRTDGNGDPLWTRTFGGSSDEVFLSLDQTTDGGFILVGYTESFGSGWYDILLVRTDENGNSLWTTTFGGSEIELSYSGGQTADGGFVVAGYSDSFGSGNSDLLLGKFDQSGKSCLGEFASPTVTSPSPAVMSPTPTVTSVSPTVTSPALVVTSPIIEVTTVCETDA